jgi:hypothetical protein
MALLLVLSARPSGVGRLVGSRTGMDIIFVLCYAIYDKTDIRIYTYERYLLDTSTFKSSISL